MGVVGAYLCLMTAYVIVALLWSSRGQMSGLSLIVWLALVAWWAQGSQIARSLLLVGGLWTIVARLAVEPEGQLPSDTIVLVGIVALQLVLLVVWRRAGETAVQGR